MFNRTVKRCISTVAGYFGPIGRGPNQGTDLPNTEKEQEEQEGQEEQEEEQEEQEDGHDSDRAMESDAEPMRASKPVPPWTPLKPPANMDPVEWHIKVALEDGTDTLWEETNLTSSSSDQKSALKPMSKIIANLDDKERGTFDSLFSLRYDRP